MDVTREQLRDGLREFHLWLTPDRTQTVDASKVFGTVHDPELVADSLLSQLSANAAHREPEPYEVTLADIAGSHVDTELALMAAILHGMEQLAPDARQRIRNWVDERFVPGRAHRA